MPVKKEREYRTLVAPLVAQSSGEKRIQSECYVEGYATTFNAPYLLYEFEDGTKIYERIDAHALDSADMSDVIMQYDHEGRVFARQSNNTLILEPDVKGLFVAADLSRTDLARGLYQDISAGMITKMSWAFTVAEESYDRETHTRTILKIKKVYDVSAVSIPANNDTEISARAFASRSYERERQELEAQGYMLSWWLNKRCIYPQIVATGTNQYLINLMVKNNCGSAAGTKRRFPLLTFLAQETIDGVAVEYANEVYAQLGQEVKARAQAGKLGYDILLNERERLFGFYLYKGNDLTATNTEGNTPCIFSRDFDNVNEQEYTASIENCGNFIYVQGAADDDGSQPVTTVDGEGATGLDLVEVFCDATDIARKYQQGETEVTIPLNTYIAMLKTRGGAELENYGKNINFVSTINTNSNLKFKADFDLGDRITCKETKWGIQIDARITEVTETYQKGEETIEATFGDSLPTLVDQIRKVR